MCFTTSESPVPLKRGGKQCLLLKMLAWGSQLQLWWRILTERALISALWVSSIDTHVGVLWSHRPTLKVSISARLLLKHWVIGAEQWGCSLCINDRRVWMCLCLLLEFFCKKQSFLSIEICLRFVPLVPRICLGTILMIQINQNFSTNTLPSWYNCPPLGHLWRTKTDIIPYIAKSS